MIKSTWHRFLGFVWVLAPLQLQYVKHFLSSSSKKVRPSGDFLQAHVWIPLKISVKILKIFPCLVTQNLVLVSNRHRRDLGGSSASGTCLTAVQVHHRSPEHTSGPTTSPCHRRASRTERRIFSTIFSGYFQRDIDRDLEWGGDPVAAGKRPVAPSEFGRRAIVNELPSLKTQMSRSEKTCEPDCVPSNLSLPRISAEDKRLPAQILALEKVRLDQSIYADDILCNGSIQAWGHPICLSDWQILHPLAWSHWCRWIKIKFKDGQYQNWVSLLGVDDTGWAG